MFQTDPFSLIILLVGLSLLPFVAMVATSYLKIVVVMSLIRNALGIQSIPPNMVINALAMILTFYIMAPVASESWNIAKTELATGRRRRSRPGRRRAARQGSFRRMVVRDGYHLEGCGAVSRVSLKAYVRQGAGVLREHRRAAVGERR